MVVIPFHTIKNEPTKHTLRSGIELQGNERTIARDKELQEETVVHEPSSSEDQAPLSQEEKNVTTAPLPQYEAVPPFLEALKERVEAGGWRFHLWILLQKL